MTGKAPDISVVIVSYNTAGILAAGHNRGRM